MILHEIAKPFIYDAPFYNIIYLTFAMLAVKILSRYHSALSEDAVSHLDVNKRGGM